jgi:hypothetical protein
MGHKIKTSVGITYTGKSNKDFNDKLLALVKRFGGVGLASAFGVMAGEPQIVRRFQIPAKRLDHFFKAVELASHVEGVPTRKCIYPDIGEHVF